MRKLVLAKTAVATFAVVRLGLATGECQGFINLGFESATIGSTGNPINPFEVEFAAAFPGWTVTIGSSHPSTAIYDTVPLNLSAICIADNAGYGVIRGHYTAVFAAGFGGNTSLSQTGLIPSDTPWLLFKAVPGSGSFGVSIDDQPLVLQNLGSGSNYTQYAADVSAWVGQSARLEFTALTRIPPVPNNYLYLDAIQFSAIPEPETWALCLLGFLGLVGCRQAARARRCRLSESGR
jgi:hypothetical protein